ncbi:MULTISPECIES: undecaprenyl-diphosphate phosphatase [Heyndrickxia]|uniref:Undecaprenyl-diphosphatase n=1 Tax=Heyndrickxia oleronia TaxID=38875 RepID=A0A8E2I976_9BACI|nr:undecaprenyl-diphosphate phosphatase [Heyndrickxia oleronia]NYV66258.1 undecaprenyl-diphosphate phosphatase [Bacillus sp. Gen3]OJH17296.1 undecaprenyl-diphosphatase [Bacillus obstructivus]MBU5212146.1 undecaprenyl-diphosphate phosphatase [Heyndrickxia oleronia]MCI1590075.1 undecaprenyl-diphosphate phosphatase [Heyndrickxia oleronia]MCI1613766.1 undecaprenyl-diphosphate phosphatase [Heyndrickxia oleronia]
MHLWESFVAFVLGLVEGLTEFAPVSSTGHMIIVDDLLLKSKELFSQEIANTFKVVIQLGSILAAVVVFWDRFLNLLGLKKNVTVEQQRGQRLKLSQVIVGLIPAGVLGFLFDDYIDEHLFSVNTVVIGLFAGAILMIVADLVRPRKPKVETVDQMTYTQAFIIGLFQCIALWPGFSRSGSTISGGVLLGLNHRAASDFTFIMAVPIMAGASFISLLKNWEYITSASIPFFIVGFISAFIFALLAIRFFLKLINKIKLIPFAIYRIILAIVIYFVFL